MLEQGKISIRQATLLMVLTILATAILFLPSIATEQAGQDAWISAIIATVNGIIISLLVVTLMRRFPNQTIVEYSEDILGKFLGKIVGLGYFWFFLHTNAIIIREFGDFMIAAFMPKTPLVVFNSMIIILAVLVVRSGLEPLGRLNEWIFILYISILLTITVFLLPVMEVENLLPILEGGILPPLKGALTPTSWFGEIIILSMIFPFLTQPHRGYRVAIGAHLIVGAFLLIGVAQAVSIFGPVLVSAVKFPIMQTVRLISLGGFFDRVEVLVMVVWIAGVFVKVSVFHYATVLSAAQLFGLSDYRPLVIPLGILAVILSIHLFQNVSDLIEFLSVTFSVYALSTFEVGVPALLLLVALARGKGGSL